MKIIITGAIGHIGSYIIRDLGIQFPMAEIVMIDNMMTQRFTSLFNLPSTGRYRFIEGDVTKMDLNLVFSGAKVVILNRDKTRYDSKADVVINDELENICSKLNNLF